MDLSKLPFELLIALAVMIVSAVKALIERVNNKRHSGQPEQEPDWFDPDTYEEEAPHSPPPVLERQRETPPPRSLEDLFKPQASPAPVKQREFAPPPPTPSFEEVKEPQLSAAKKRALEQIEARKKASKKKSRQAHRSDLLTLPEREFLRLQLRSPRSARNAMALNEVLSPPLALREEPSHTPSHY